MNKHTFSNVTSLLSSSSPSAAGRRGFRAMKTLFTSLVSVIAIASATANCTMSAEESFDSAGTAPDEGHEKVGAAAESAVDAYYAMDVYLGTGADALSSGSAVYLSAQHPDGT